LRTYRCNAGRIILDAASSVNFFGHEDYQVAFVVFFIQLLPRSVIDPGKLLTKFRGVDIIQLCYLRTLHITLI
jgi:hypothetical protein